ncbi:hypothetical protein H9P43_004630 [Blastocladiella emersonii ATCC 22665]|nr:hypothetical protein H9P43_004630 [Blastocladiella emersonii ATCC 22665]
MTKDTDSATGSEPAVPVFVEAPVAVEEAAPAVAFAADVLPTITTTTSAARTTESDSEDDLPLVKSVHLAPESPTNEPMTPERAAELRMQLQQAKLREAQLQRAVHALEEELGRAQSHAVAFDTAVDEMSRLRERMESMSQKLRLEEERNHEMEASRRMIDAEYESLSAVLFDQANNMVKEQNVLRAHAERRAFMAETRLRDAEGVVESLRVELAGLKRLLEERDEVAESVSDFDAASCHSNDAGSEHHHHHHHHHAAPAPPVNRTTGEEWQNDVFPMDLQAPPLASDNPAPTVVPAPEHDAAHPESAVAHLVLTPPPAARRGSHVSVTGSGAAAAAAAATALATLHPLLATEFHKFLTILFAPTGRGANYLTLADRENALYRTKFMERLFDEDVKPTLSFPNISWLQKKTLAGAITANSIAITPRRTPILVRRKPKSSASSAAAATTLRAAKNLIPVALTSLSGVAAVASAASGAGVATPTTEHATSPFTATAAAPSSPAPGATPAQQPEPVAAEPEEPLEYAPETLDCWGCGTTIINQAPLTVVSLSDTDTQRPVCKLCRAKLVAVCHVFAYLRRLGAGIVPTSKLRSGVRAMGHSRSGSTASAVSASESVVVVADTAAEPVPPVPAVDEARVAEAVSEATRALGHERTPSTDSTDSSVTAPLVPPPAPAPHSVTPVSATTATSAFFQRLSSVTSGLSSRIAAASAGHPTVETGTASPAPGAAAAAGSAGTSPTTAAPAAVSAAAPATAASASSSPMASVLSLSGGSSLAYALFGGRENAGTPTTGRAVSPGPSAPATAAAAPEPPALEPTVKLSPDLVGALWADLCRLRQRMFLARLGVPCPGSEDLFDAHPLVVAKVAENAAKAASKAAAPAPSSVVAAEKAVPVAAVAAEPPVLIVVGETGKDAAASPQVDDAAAAVVAPAADPAAPAPSAAAPAASREVATAVAVAEAML